MKIIKSTIFWATIIFVTLTLLTMKKEAASDGVDAYGFPFIYFDHFVGKCESCYDKFGLKPLYLLVDISFAITFGLLITIFRRKFINESNGMNQRR